MRIGEPKPRVQLVQPLNEEYRYIALTKDQVAIVDASDYEWLMQWNWCATWQRDRFYAMRVGPRIKGKTRKTIFMHRQILGLESGDPREGDHREPSQTLDNRRNNLRIATHTQNLHNARKSKLNTSGYKGVSYDSSRRKWDVRFKVNGKLRRIGRYDSLSVAGIIAKAAIKRLHGEFAREK